MGREVSRTFTKLFSSITESTVWCEPHSTVRVWIAMLAKADHAGRVFAAIPGLAHLSRVTTEECETAIETFLSPDKYSRTPDFEGRRIERIDGGWRLLNHAKYRQLRDEETVKESKRNYINARREKEREQASGVENVEQSRPLYTHAEAEAEVDTDKARSKSKSGAPSAKRGCRLPVDWQPSDDDVVFAVDLRVDWRREAEAFRDYWFSKPGASAAKLDWSATWRNWIRRSTQKLAVKAEPQKSKTLQAIEKLQRMANGQPLDGSGSWDGVIEAPVPPAGRLSFGGHD